MNEVNLPAIEPVTDEDVMVARLTAANGWRPIETAPKDTLVLVHCQYAGEPAIARLTDAGWKLGVEHHETKCGTYCLGGSPGGYATFVTHWMPLPAAPSGTKENGDG